MYIIENIRTIKSKTRKCVVGAKVVSPRIVVESSVEDIESIDEIMYGLEGKSKVEFISIVGTKEQIENNKDKIKNIKSEKVKCIVKVGDLDELDKLMLKVGCDINIVAKLDSSLKDLRRLKHICENYPNLELCGGKLISIDGIRLGCMSKRPKSNIVSDGCYIGHKYINIEDEGDITNEF